MIHNWLNRLKGEELRRVQSNQKNPGKIQMTIVSTNENIGYPNIGSVFPYQCIILSLFYRVGNKLRDEVNCITPDHYQMTGTR